MSTLSELAKQLRDLDARDIRNWLKRGELLTEAQTLCQPLTGFQAFLRQNAIPKRTAYKAIAAWRDFGGVPTSARFTKEAMDILSASEGAREKAIELSKKQRINGRVARQVLVDYLPPGFFGDNVPKKIAADGRRKFKGDGFNVIVEFPGPTSAADMIGALTTVISQLRDESRLGGLLGNEPAPTAPISPLDRLRSRIAG